MTTPSLPASPQLFPYSRKLFQYVGHAGFDILDRIGQFAQTGIKVTVALLQGRLSFKAFWEQAAFVGVDALGISLILTLFAGMVIALQVAQELAKQGGGNLVGALVALAILRELAPIMTGFAVISMVGSAYAAELGTMKTQKQIDALEVLGVCPLRYLVLPRVLGMCVMLPLMTNVTAAAGIIGGMAISNWVADIGSATYIESIWKNIEPWDLFGMQVKAVLFAILIALFACSIGLSTQGGAKEVGETTTRAVVWCVVAMAIADYFASLMLFQGV